MVTFLSASVLFKKSANLFKSTPDNINLKLAGCLFSQSFQKAQFNIFENDALPVVSTKYFDSTGIDNISVEISTLFMMLFVDCADFISDSKRISAPAL